MLEDPATGLIAEILDMPLHGNPRDNYFGGDERVNENPGLFAISGFFVKLHNHICDKLKIIFPNLDDERMFEEARRRNIAYYQHFVIDEYLPVLNGVDIGPYKGYDSSVNL